MPMLNPFKKYDLDDFPDVFVPLANAPRHPSVIAENRRRSSIAATLKGDAPTHEKTLNGKGGLTKPDSKDNPGSDDEPFTLEQLRAEIEADIAASGHDTAYDRKAKVINKAIQDIGMGQYQWKLFVLCGELVLRSV
jgi:hypothetical protein